MHVAFIIPPSPDHKKIIRMIDCSHEAKARYLWQPNDYLIISSLLQPDDTAVLIDGTADALSERAFFDRLRSLPRRTLCIFALSSVCWESDYRSFREARQVLSGSPCYVLGDIFLEEGYRRLILEECDGIVFNPYLLDLPRMSDAGGSRRTLPGVSTDAVRPPFTSPKRPIEIRTSPPRHELFQGHGYRFPFATRFRFATVTTVWGCPFTCAYCTDSQIPPVVRHPDDVLQELANVDRLGIRELFFADKTFGYAPSLTTPLLRVMASSYRFSWTCYYHPQTYSEDLLDLMGAAGCHTLIIGIDSADIASLRRYKRYVDPAKLDALLAHAGRLGMSVCADFILGLPHEGEPEVRRTIDAALALPIDFASFNIAAPLPGSCIRESASRAGKLVFGSEGFDTSAQAGVLGTDHIGVERIKALRQKAIRSFYLRPSYLLRRLRKTRGVQHLLIQLLEMASMMRKA